MTSVATIDERRVNLLESELANFQSMMRYVNQIPESVDLTNIEIFGRSFPLNGILGGDHIVVLDFKNRYNLDARIEKALAAGNTEVAENLGRCREKVGVLVADVSGHDTTDALLAAMLHQAFLTGVLYELETEGHVTARLFEVLNSRFAKSSSVNKFITMIYGEICDDGTFRFISAGHPKPLIFSAEYDKLVEIDPERMKNVLPIGVFPSEGDIDESESDARLPRNMRFDVNEVSLLGTGDILLLGTDGLSEHANGDHLFAPRHLEESIRSVKELPPRQIVDAIHDAMVNFAPPQDDTSLVVIKKVS
ncbi:MAG: PP2C family protein-serine/threonine phosphatase [Acidobacteriota bacterium]|jgi:serine phosphatase RsbU (regulator of sigma subunit)